MEKPLAKRAGVGWQGKHTNVVSRATARGCSWARSTRRSRFRPMRRTRPVRFLHAMPDGVPDRRLFRALSPRCDALHLLSHDRARRPDPARATAEDGQSDLRLRRLPRGLPVEPLRYADNAGEADRARRFDRAAARRLRGLDDAAFRALFSGSPVKRIGRNRFVRNVLTAIGNSGDTTLRPSAETLTADPDPIVAEAAQWACARLDAPAPDEHCRRCDEVKETSEQL